MNKVIIIIIIIKYYDVESSMILTECSTMKERRLCNGW